jgi:hypothetical protein
MKTKTKKGKQSDKKYKPTSKEALKILNPKEQQIKEVLMQDIIASGANNQEVVRVLAFLINCFKKIKRKKVGK